MELHNFEVTDTSSFKMLQQILRDMYIDPELLAELSDEQRQILFVRMRDEQLRRWKYHEDRFEKDLKKRPKKALKPGKKKVQFLSGKDGNEWVWVMGHHPDDLSIEEILEKEAIEKAMQQAEKEAEELRQKQEEELKKKMAEEKKRLEKERLEREAELKRQEEEAALYQSLKEARLMAEKLEMEREEGRKSLRKLEEEEEMQLQNTLEKAKNMRSKRSSELYMTWREMRNLLQQKGTEDEKVVEASWKEQEKKAKEAEKQMREIAQRAREEHRRSLRSAAKMSNLSLTATETLEEKPPIPPKTHISHSSILNNMCKSKNSVKRPNTPKNKAAVIQWFKEEEKPKGVGINPETKKIEPWFHGLITRSEAEEILIQRPIGSFLVRVSERIWGFTISYQSEERCKHFLIDASDGTYHFFGTNYQVYSSLHEIITHHTKNPITLLGQEILLFPCGQQSDPPNYAELFQGDITESTNL